MKYKKYPEYKDSGIEWLGEIPEHWTIPKLKLFISTTKGFAFKSNDFREEGVPVVKMSEIKNGTINRSSVFLPEQFKQSHKQVMLAYQDIVVSTVGSSAEVKNSAVGQIGIVPKNHHESLLNQNTVIFSPNRKVLSNSYLPYILKSQAYREHLDLHAHGTANQASLNLEDMLKFVFSFPPLQEQQTIANYLDIATAKINTLIQKQTRLIELLKEKRQAVISHAVTRGLDSSVPMKDSGVEWLGEIPEHWEVNTLRRDLIEHKQGFYTTETYNDNGTKLLRITDIKDSGNVDFSKCPRVNMDYTDKHFLLKNGDFVFARTGGAGSFGYITNLFEDVLFASYLIRFRFKNDINSVYLKYYFMSSAFVNSINSNIHGGVNKNIHAEDIKNSYITKPKLKEQKEIAIYLDEKTSKIDNLITKATKAIDLLKEKRTALISATVTGKIDVRDNQSQ